MTKVNGFQTGDQALILNAADIQFGERFFTNGDVVTVKVEDAIVFGVNVGAHVFIVPVSGENPILSENGGLVTLGDEFEAIAKVEDGGKIGLFDKVRSAQLPEVKVGDTVLALPGAGEDTLGVIDGETYTVVSIVLYGGDLFYALGQPEGHFVGRHEIELLESSDKIGNHADNEITISHTYDDGKLNEHTPKFKKGERVLTLPGASAGTFGVKDGEVYEITEVYYVGEGDFLYRMGRGSGNFVREDELISVTFDKIGLFDGMDAMEQDADLPKVEVGDIVRALPGASDGTHSVVDGEVYEVTKVEPFMGEVFYELGTDGSNGVYREEIELLKKASDDADHIGNHAEEIEVGDLVRALPGAGNFTVSVVDGEVYEVVRKSVGTFGSTFYHLGEPEGNGVYREEIELVSKGAK